MPAFNFSGSNKTSSKNYGYLVDQLDIKKNLLESDGKLTPGDYDLLSKEAQKIYAHPGLTPDQRSNIQVKISQYQQEKSTTQLKDTRDVGRLNREIKDDTAKSVMLYGNNPELFLQANSDALRLKLDRLSDSINSLDQAGDDASGHLNEFNSTLNEYNDMLQALDDVRGYDKSGQPKSCYAAFVVTNSEGEINDVKIGRVGSQGGYVETNGLYGGLPIYGKINRKEGSKNVFVLGNERFSAADVMIPDPQNPGAMKSNRLISESQQSQGGRGFDTAKAGTYKDVDLTQVRPQSSVRAGKWVEGDKGFLYQRQADGKYVKYVGASKEKLGISDNDIIKVPRSFESSILRDVARTVDGTQPFEPQPSTAPMAPNITAPAPTDSAAPAPLGGGNPRTPSPTERSPQGAGGYAKRAINSAKSFLGNLFR